MRSWWVNQNYRQKMGGGYMWSPKVNRNGKLNPFYEFMREVNTTPSADFRDVAGRITQRCV